MRPEGPSGGLGERVDADFAGLLNEVAQQGNPARDPLQFLARDAYVKARE